MWLIFIISWQEAPLSYDSGGIQEEAPKSRDSSTSVYERQRNDQRESKQGLLRLVGVQEETNLFEYKRVINQSERISKNESCL